MTKISNSLIRTFNPCYDPIRFLKDSESLSVVDFLKKDEIPPQDRLWVVLRSAVIGEKTLRQHGIACLRYAVERFPDANTKDSARSILDTYEQHVSGGGVEHSVLLETEDRISTLYHSLPKDEHRALSAVLSMSYILSESRPELASCYSVEDEVAIDILILMLESSCKTPDTIAPANRVLSQEVGVVTFFNPTLPTDSKTRKEYPIHTGCIRYFPAALAGVAKTSKLGNDKHNPGEALHHARGKSMDHGDCIIRHLIDLEDLLSKRERGGSVPTDQILSEASSLAWRALALSQELHEKLGEAPLAPGAK